MSLNDRRLDRKEERVDHPDDSPLIRQTVWRPSRWSRATGPPAQPFARNHTAADVAWLVEIHKAHEDVCGSAIVHLFRRAYGECGGPRHERLATLSASHLHNLHRGWPALAMAPGPHIGIPSGPRPPRKSTNVSKEGEAPGPISGLVARAETRPCDATASRERLPDPPCGPFPNGGRLCLM